jgi:arsenite-transporting ATPase
VLLQDVSGGKPVPIEGTDLPLWGMEIDPEEAKAEFMTFSSNNNVGAQVCVMSTRGYGLCEQGGAVRKGGWNTLGM